MDNRNRIQKEIVDSLPPIIHGLLHLSPRIGKTKIGIDIIKKQKPKTILWVTPNTKLRDIDIPSEFKQWKAISYLKKTHIICYASLSDHIGKYDLVILDEYQDLTPANASPLFNGNVKYKSIIGLSGTHPNHKEKNELYNRLKLSILTSMTIDEAVGSGLIAPYKIKVVELRLDNKQAYLKGGSIAKPFLQTEEARYSYLTRLINIKQFSGQIVPKFFYLNRMRFIYDLKSKQVFAKKFVAGLQGRTLVFTGSISQAEELSEHTYHSKTDDKKLNLFLDGKIDTLACVNAGGVGFTYRDVDNFVIVQVNSDGKGDATQKIARSLVLQDNYKANIFILCVINTVDEDWKNKVLKNFNLENVEHVSYKNYEHN